MSPRPSVSKSVHWQLPVVMAMRRIKSATELHRRLNAIGMEISSAQLSRMMHKRPQRLSMELLDALVTVLECEITDLLVIGEPGADDESTKQTTPKKQQGSVPAPRPDIAGPKVTPFPLPPPKGKA